MTDSAPASDDARNGRSRRMELLIGYLLLAGVSVSSLLITVGVAWDWQQSGHLGLSHLLSGSNVGALLSAETDRLFARGLTPQRLVDLGILVLLATPFLRVAASFVFFAVERDVKYSVFTFVVLAILSYALFIR